MSVVYTGARRASVVVKDAGANNEKAPAKPCGGKKTSDKTKKEKQI